MRTMYDAINPELIPLDANPEMVAGYVNGIWPSYNGYVSQTTGKYVPSIRERFPNAIHVSIAVNTQADAQVLDCEFSDATPEECPPWALRQRARGQEPTIYCNQLNTWPYVINAFKNQGVPEPQYWVARYDGVQTLPPDCSAKQYGGVANAYDLSIVADYWEGIDMTAMDLTPAAIAAIKTAVTQDLGLTSSELEGMFNEALVTLRDIQDVQKTLATILGDVQAAQSTLATILTDIQNLGSSVGGATKQDVIDAINNAKITTS
jgi:hypothetical protein